MRSARWGWGNRVKKTYGASYANANSVRSFPRVFHRRYSPGKPAPGNVFLTF